MSGTVAYDKLRQALAPQERCPSAAEAPTPHDLGVPTCDGELSEPLLHSIGQGLNRWRKQLAEEIQRRPAQRRDSPHLARESHEIDTLAERLTTVPIGKASSPREPNRRAPLLSRCGRRSEFAGRSARRSAPNAAPARHRLAGTSRLLARGRRRRAAILVGDNQHARRVPQSHPPGEAAQGFSGP